MSIYRYLDFEIDCGIKDTRPLMDIATACATNAERVLLRISRWVHQWLNFGISESLKINLGGRVLPLDLPIDPTQNKPNPLQPTGKKVSTKNQENYQRDVKNILWFRIRVLKIFSPTSKHLASLGKRRI